MWRWLVVLAVVVWSRGVSSVHFLKAVVEQQLSKVHTAYTTAPHNHSQHNQPSSHEVLTSLVVVLLMMGIMMPETCWDWLNSRNIHLIIVAPVGSIIHFITVFTRAGHLSLSWATLINPRYRSYWFKICLNISSHLLLGLPKSFLLLNLATKFIHNLLKIIWNFRRWFLGGRNARTLEVGPSGVSLVILENIIGLR
jgi:hypothetical protein